MALEIDSIDDCGLDYRYSSPNYMQQPESRFHNAIFSSANFDPHFSRKPVFDKNRLPLDERVEDVFMNSSGAKRPMITKGKAEVRVETIVQWGGTSGPTYEVGVSGKVADEKGNYVEVAVKHDNEGQGTATAAAGAAVGNEQGNNTTQR
jgi:hypothetical protein